MATITLEVPDELAQRLEGMTDQLPVMLASLLNAEDYILSADIELQSRPWMEVIRFLSQPPDVSEIIEFQLSDELQDRLEELLFLNNEGTLTTEESSELDSYMQVIKFFNLLKASLRAKLQ
jgi:hypothetical protein